MSNRNSIASGVSKPAAVTTDRGHRSREHFSRRSEHSKYECLDQYDSSSTPAAASAARPACRRAASATRTRDMPMIHLEYVDRAALDADGAGGLHALRLADLRRGLPRRRHQEERGRRRAERRKPRCVACNNCVLACPFGVPKMITRIRADDEVRYVLRPHLGRQEADVRDRLPQSGPCSSAPARKSSSRGRAGTGQPLPVSAARPSRTKVNMMVPRNRRAAVHRRDLDAGRAARTRFSFRIDVPSCSMTAMRWRE